MAELKRFTHYNCITGCGKYGIYTGAYRDPKPTDDHCYCGALLTEDAPDGFLYRVEFETISPHQADAMQQQQGKDIWQRLSDGLWQALEWMPVSREDKSEHSIRKQYEGLKRWAETREQPIRNVRLLRSHCGEWESI